MSSDYIDPAHFQLVNGEKELSLYQWGDRDVNHWFCKSCGIYTFHDSTYEPGKYRVNLGCIEGMNPRELAIREFDGRNLL